LKASKVALNWARWRRTEEVGGSWWNWHRTPTGAEPMALDDDDESCLI